MAVYIFTGKLGGGKTLCGVGRLRDKLKAGCKAATNLDIDLVALFGREARNLSVIRVPDKPKIHDLQMIGNGNLTYDESQNGLLLLDECGTWFNSRNWSDKDRKPVNDWFLHARKLGWDVILIIQDIKLLDSQAREALAEHTVFCKRLDRIQVPYLGTLYKAFTGYRLSGPKIHVARCVYGTNVTDFLADRWVYRGTDLFSAYDTKQLFLEDYPHAVHSLLTPWHLKGRYARPKDKEFYMRLTKIYWKRFRGPVALAVGAFFGMFLSQIIGPILHAQADPVAVEVVAELPIEVATEELEVDKETFQPPPEPAPEISDLFAGFRIVAYLESSDAKFYTIDRGGESYTTRELRANGFYVQEVSNCEITVAYRDKPRDRVHIHAPNCIPRKFDHEMYDLSQLRIVPQFAGVEPLRF